MSEFLGKVYIICFDRPFQSGKSKPITHYVGFAVDLSARLWHHKRGSGSTLLAAVNRAGIGYKITRTFFDVSREFERRVKRHRNAADYCPNCCVKRNKAPRRPKGYIEPPAPQKRAYKSRIDGNRLIISRITVTSQDLQKRLAKRMKVGTEYSIDDRVFRRVNLRIHKSHFLEITPAVGYTSARDENRPIRPIEINPGSIKIKTFVPDVEFPNYPDPVRIFGSLRGLAVQGPKNVVVDDCDDIPF
jgi:hypothetical protein